jgi:DNA-binding MarR family transcriptional regulator
MQGTRRLPAEQPGSVRHHNIGRLLLDSFRLFSQRMLVHLHANGFTDLRPIHTSLLRNIDAAGTRITEIGDRSSMTKQAVGQLIKECERLGYLGTRIDPNDRRAKIVRYTRKGERFLGALPQVFEAATNDIETMIGSGRMDTLGSILEMLVANAAKGDSNRNIVPRAARRTKDSGSLARRAR